MSAFASTAIPKITSPDPVFAAIAKHEAMEAAFEGMRDKQLPAAVHEAEVALKALVATTPTTVAGCAALLRYVEKVTAEAEQGELFDGFNVIRPIALDLLSRIAGALDRVDCGAHLSRSMAQQ